MSQSLYRWLVLGAVFSSAIARAEDPMKPLQDVATANALDSEGKAPFHLKMTFKIFPHDLVPAEEGMVEEWWAGAKGYRIIITAPSFKDSEPGGAAIRDADSRRKAYLVRELLSEAVHPIRSYVTVKGVKLLEVKRTEDKVTLDCLRLKPTDKNIVDPQSTDYCINTATKALRLTINDSAQRNVTRNSLGVFHDTNVALDLQIAYRNDPEITGHVVALQTFDPVGPNVELGTAPMNAGAPEGELVQYIKPVYPPVAKIARMRGKVVLKGIINKEGRVEKLSVTSSTNPMFNNYALDAVRQWVYVPYTADGQPIDLEQEIAVNFDPDF